MNPSGEKRHLFSNFAQRGLIMIRNLHTARTHLVVSEDIARDIPKIRFQLDLGNYPNQELQEEYDQTGLELYSIDAFLFSDDTEDLSVLLVKKEQELIKQGILLY